MNKLFRFLMVAAIIPPLLFTCSQQGIYGQLFRQATVYPMLEPGDSINTMLLTTGSEQAVPLSSFCFPTAKSEHWVTVDCREVSFAKLAIGHTFGVMDLLPKSSDWSKLTWKLYFDGHPIDLNAFGTRDFIRPDLISGPSPVREVFRTMKVWDVVLVNPTPGPHTLHGEVLFEEGRYTWVVNFTVETLSFNPPTSNLAPCLKC